MNLQGKVIKICSEKTRLLPNKLYITSWTRFNFCNDRRSVVPYSHSYESAIHQSYTSVHSVQAVFKVQNHMHRKTDNETRDQLTYTCNVSAKPMRNYLNLLIIFSGYLKAN